MKELQNKPQLIRGLIYDDPSLADETALITANAVSNMVDEKKSMEEYLNQCKIEGEDEDTIPTADEMNAYGIMLSIISPEPEMRNLIIPSNMIDDNLYKNLKKIDIGPKIINGFDYIRSDKLHKNEETKEDNKVYIHLVNKDGSVKSIEFDNPDEASEFLGNFIDSKEVKNYIGFTEPLYTIEF